MDWGGGPEKIRAAPLCAPEDPRFSVRRRRADTNSLASGISVGKDTFWSR
jgi:hypothetical protein